MNFKLLQKHVSALTRLSVTPQRLNNRTSTINVKLAGCANLPPISCLQHETFLPNAYFFSIIYEACHFPLPKASPYQRGCPNLPNFEAHPDSVFLAAVFKCTPPRLKGLFKSREKFHFAIHVAFSSVFLGYIKKKKAAKKFLLILTMSRFITHARE